MFHKRDLPQSAKLGERLAQVRSESGWAIVEVAKKISVKPKYLAAIEAGRYRDLPGPVYARNFVRLYAQALGVETGAVIDMFDKEFQIVTSGKIERHLPSERVSTEFHWMRKHARLLLAGAVIAAVLFYLGIQVERLLTPPILTVTSPAGDVTTKNLQITVAGHTELTASVTINNQPVQLDDAGNFKESIDLSTGLNTLVIGAAKKHSSQRVVVRRVLVETATDTGP